MPPDPDATRWALLVEYDGTDYVGWQRQKNGLSVQETLERALEGLTGFPVRVVGAGRTDTGVHAEGQVAAFTTPKPLDADNVIRGGNAYLPPTVRIRGARAVPGGFNPRRDAVRRHYRYRMAQGGVAPGLERAFQGWTRANPDWDRVREALDGMRGVHDFRAFRSSRCTSRRTVLNLERAELILTPRGPDPAFGMLAEFHFECRSFLHNMVRLLVGAALETGRGGLSLEALDGLFCEGIRGRNRFSTAPARGLCLVSAVYPSGLGLWG